MEIGSGTTSWVGGFNQTWDGGAATMDTPWVNLWGFMRYAVSMTR